MPDTFSMTESEVGKVAERRSNPQVIGFLVSVQNGDR